jgi:predicted small lipoprotein YifL
MRLSPLIFIAMLALIVSGCGQKGPLQRPDQTLTNANILPPGSIQS